MIREKIGINEGKVTIKGNAIIQIVLLFLLILPDDFFSFLSLYKSATPSYIPYKWLNYEFGAVQLFILLYGIKYYKSKGYKLLIGLIILFLFRELFYLWNDNNLFKQSAYELYLTFCVGFVLTLITIYNTSDSNELEEFFSIYCLMNLLTVLIQIITERNIVIGRFHASNLDVNGTGLLAGLYIIYLLKKKSRYKIPIIGYAFLVLIFSGSRINLILTAFFSIVMITESLFHTIMMRKITQDKNLKKRIVAAVISIMVLVIIINFSISNNWFNFNRIITLFGGNASITSDASYLGRMDSIQTGIDIIKDNPLGISCYFVNLQSECYTRGYPTFPHSGIISWYIVYGPIILILYFLWLKNAYILCKYRHRFFWLITYMIASTIVSGGPITNFKSIYTFAMITAISMLLIRNECGYSSGTVGKEIVPRQENILSDSRR